MDIAPVEQAWYLDIFRNAMWSIAKGILWLLDGFFNVINQIWRYRFFDNDYVNKILSGAIIVACSWLVIKVLIEIIMNHIIKNDGRSSPLVVYRGVVLAIAMMFLVTPLFQFGFDVSTKLTDAVISVTADSSGTAEDVMSKALVKSMIYNNEMKDENKTNLVNNWKTIKINETEGGFIGIGDVYKYSVNFFMLIVLSIVTLFLLFFVAIQMAKRVMELALFKIVAPFCCISLVNNQPSSFSAWVKSTMGLFLVTVVQFVGIGLMLNMFGSAIQDNGTLTGIFLIIGALLFIIGTPTLINSLLGQQTGIMSGFGDIQSLMAISGGIQTALSFTSSHGISALGTGVSVIPKTAGHFSGLSQQFKNYKENGSSTLGALGKTTLSEIGRPFVSIYQKAVDNISNKYNVSKNNATNPFGMDTSNPFKNPHSMRFNPIRNQYMNNDNLNKNDIGGSL